LFNSQQSGFLADAALLFSSVSLIRNTYMSAEEMETHLLVLEHSE
jgi:hypothetical protein